jgi:hypothetical protein
MADTFPMREQPLETLSLFDTVPDAVLSESAPTNTPERVARDFVRWLFGFGAEFRNSPDMINFRFWAQGHQVEVPDGEEREIVAQARVLFLKKVGQLTRKPEPKPQGV